MNRLVTALIQRPQIIEQMAGQSEAPFAQLRDLLADVLFSQSELRRIQLDSQLRRRLERSYLPTISAPEWGNALSLTESRSASNSGWWTVMVAGASGRFGLTVPQDGSQAELIALYTGLAENARVIVYYPASATVDEAPDGPHCGPPSRGRCLEGSCRGCVAFEVYDEPSHSTGIKCMCSHQNESR
jgi:hypothetical protein